MPVIWICIGFAVGIVCADLWTWGIWVWLVMFLIISAAAFIFHYRIRSKLQGGFARIGGLVVAAVIAFALGGVRCCLSFPDLEDPTFLPSYAGSGVSVEIMGLVVDYPDRRDQIQNLKVKVESVSQVGEDQPQPAYGFLLAKVPVEEKISY